MIRAQFGAQFQAQARQRKASRDVKEAGGAAPPRVDTPPPSGQEPATIQQMMAARVRALSPDDPERQRKAFRIFLESVLTQAFGRERLDDRGFDQMVSTVLLRMEGDAELHAALREAGELLLADTVAGPGVGSSRRIGSAE